MSKKNASHTLQWRDHLQHLHSIAQAALDAVDPYRAIRCHLQVEDHILMIGDERIQLEETRIFVVGAGKAGVTMARAVEDILGERIYGSLISVPHLPEEPFSFIQFIQGGHPLPSEGSIQAGYGIRDLLDQTSEKDLVLVLISGGGSALLELPLEGLELTDLQKVNDLLIKSGAPIQEINSVRKQLSRVKGGGLAELAAPARTIGLILSDVIGDPVDTIASGPLIRSSTTVKDTWSILEKYNLVELIPERVKKELESSTKIKLKYPTLDEGKITNIIIGNNTKAAEAAVTHAHELGFKAIHLTSKLQGEASDVGRTIAALMKAAKLSKSVSPLCMIFGGETTVTVRGSGVGGRNQELALAAAIELEGVPNVAMMTLATDGIDGPTPAAGAVIHGKTVAKGYSLNLDAVTFLANNDAYSYFHTLGDNVILGPTGTNVNDLIFCLIYAS